MSIRSKKVISHIINSEICCCDTSQYCGWMCCNGNIYFYSQINGSGKIGILKTDEQEITLLATNYNNGEGCCGGVFYYRDAQSRLRCFYGDEEIWTGDGIVHQCCNGYLCITLDNHLLIIYDGVIVYDDLFNPEAGISCSRECYRDLRFQDADGVNHFYLKGHNVYTGQYTSVICCDNGLYLVFQNNGVCQVVDVATGTAAYEGTYNEHTCYTYYIVVKDTDGVSRVIYHDTEVWAGVITTAQEMRLANVGEVQNYVVEGFYVTNTTTGLSAVIKKGTVLWEPSFLAISQCVCFGRYIFARVTGSAEAEYKLFFDFDEAGSGMDGNGATPPITQVQTGFVINISQIDYLLNFSGYFVVTLSTGANAKVAVYYEGGLIITTTYPNNSSTGIMYNGENNWGDRYFLIGGSSGGSTLFFDGVATDSTPPALFPFYIFRQNGDFAFIYNITNSSSNYRNVYIARNGMIDFNTALGYTPSTTSSSGVAGVDPVVWRDSQNNYYYTFIGSRNQRHFFINGTELSNFVFSGNSYYESYNLSFCVGTDAVILNWRFRDYNNSVGYHWLYTVAVYLYGEILVAPVVLGNSSPTSTCCGDKYLTLNYRTQQGSDWEASGFVCTNDGIEYSATHTNVTQVLIMSCCNGYAIVTENITATTTIQKLIYDKEVLLEGEEIIVDDPYCQYCAGFIMVRFDDNYYVYNYGELLFQTPVDPGVPKPKICCADDCEIDTCDAFVAFHDPFNIVTIVGTDGTLWYQYVYLDETPVCCGDRQIIRNGIMTELLLLDAAFGKLKFNTCTFERMELSP